MITLISKRLQEAFECKSRLLQDELLKTHIAKTADLCISSLKSGGKILFCGNGGSASDAQHLAAELSGRYKLDRRPLYAEALHVNTSYVTAVANDYSYNDIYSRLVEGIGRSGDVLFAISTSGNSENILRAAQKAQDKGMHVIGMSGSRGGKLKELCHINFLMPSDETARIQEGHILVGHIICELIDEAFLD